MSQKGRSARVAELIREEIAKLLVRGLKDPRIGFVSVMAVRMSPDLRYANVYVSLYGGESEKKSSLIALQNSAGWIRREIGKFLRMRFTPEVRFFPDDTLEEVYHLEEIFHEIHAEQAAAPMIRMDLPGIASELLGASSLLLTTHESPDGDALGSMLGLYHWLRASGKDRVTCAMADPAPRIYRNLPGAKKIVYAREDAGEFDAVVLVDVSLRDRIGQVASWITPGMKIITIDHHLTESPAGTVGFIDSSYAAAGEIIFELFEQTETPLSPEAVHCLYVAQVTDTCGYRFSNTNARSHRIAARLLESGVDVEGICSQVFDTLSLAKFGLLRRVLDRMELEAAGQLAYTYVTAQDLDDVGGLKEDTDGLVNFARNIEGVQVGALFNAVDAETTKVSLRARRGFNAAEFLSRYGGGGHAAAAGATIHRPYQDVVTDLVKALKAALNAPAAGGTE